MKKNQIDNLFEGVRNQSPSYSYAEIEQSFLNSAVQPLSVLEKFKQLSNTKKIIIMVSTMAVLGTIITLLASSSGDAPSKKVEDPIPQKTENYTITTDEKGKTKTTYYNDDKEVVLVEISESSFTLLEDVLDEPLPTPKRAIEQERKDPAFETVLLANKNQSPPDSTITEDSSKDTKSTLTTFVITHNIKDSKLAEIKKEAAKAGVTFSYRIVVWKGKVKKCKIWMTSKTGENCNQTVSFDLRGRKFTKTIGWRTDEDGKFAEIITYK